jgi:hypothetical protein
MSETNGSDKKYVVLAMIEYPDRKDASKTLTKWVRIGKGWPNRDGSINLRMDAFPIGTNKLQVREDDHLPLVPGTRRPGMETIEVRP